MKIRFKVHHSYGLHFEEVFSIEELRLDKIPLDEISREIVPLLIEWTTKNYNHGDALPSWEVVN